MALLLHKLSYCIHSIPVPIGHAHTSAPHLYGWLSENGVQALGYLSIDVFKVGSDDISTIIGEETCIAESGHIQRRGKKPRLN